MKKYLFIGLALFSLVSCSDDSNVSGGTDTTTTVLPKTMSVTKNNATTVYTYSYDTQQLTSVTASDGTSIAYTYQNNHVTAARHYSNGGLVQADNFVFDGTGTLSSYVVFHTDLQNPANNYAQKFVYTYGQGSITATEYRGDMTDQNTLYATSTLTTSGNNIIKYFNGTTTIQYAFDFSNSPFLNITDYALFIVTQQIGGFNNIQASQHTVNGVVTETQNNYTMNAAGYPQEVDTTEEDGSTTVTRYTY